MIKGCWEFNTQYPTQGLGNHACACEEHPWPYPDLYVCKWATEKNVMEVPGAPAVFTSDYENAKMQDCFEVKSSCSQECASLTGDTNKNNSITSCFKFSSQPNQINAICMCSNGSIPSSLNDFKLNSSMDKETGKMVGKIDAAVSFGFIVTFNRLLLVIVITSSILMGV